MRRNFAAFVAWLVDILPLAAIPVFPPFGLIWQRCLAPGCYRNPHYGVSRLIDPNSKAQYCTKHKTPGEISVCTPTGTTAVM